MAIDDKQRVHQIILKCAKLYESNLNGKNFMYVIRGIDNVPFTFEVQFTTPRFLHLMGVNTKLSVTEFYEYCINERLSETQHTLKPDGYTIQKSTVSIELMGIHKRAKMYGESALLFTDKMIGNVRGCVGFRLIDGARFHYPNTLLEADIKKTTDDYLPILAVYQKLISESLYSVICYKSNIYKDIEYNMLTWLEEIQKRIDMTNLISSIGT